MKDKYTKAASTIKKISFVVYFTKSA